MKHQLPPLPRKKFEFTLSMGYVSRRPGDAGYTPALGTMERAIVCAGAEWLERYSQIDIDNGIRGIHLAGEIAAAPETDLERGLIAILVDTCFAYCGTISDNILDLPTLLWHILYVQRYSWDTYRMFMTRRQDRFLATQPPLIIDHAN